MQALKKVYLYEVFEDGLMTILEADQLSQGQRQLFCLAAAILRDAKIVLLDEVTSR